MKPFQRNLKVCFNDLWGQSTYYEKFASWLCYYTYQILIRSGSKQQKYLRKSRFLNKVLEKKTKLRTDVVLLWDRDRVSEPEPGAVGSRVF